MPGTSGPIPDSFFPSDVTKYGYTGFGVWLAEYKEVTCAPTAPAKKRSNAFDRRAVTLDMGVTLTAAVDPLGTPTALVSPLTSAVGGIESSLASALPNVTSVAPISLPTLSPISVLQAGWSGYSANDTRGTAGSLGLGEAACCPVEPSVSSSTSVAYPLA